MIVAIFLASLGERPYGYDTKAMCWLHDWRQAKNVRVIKGGNRLMEIEYPIRMN